MAGAAAPPVLLAPFTRRAMKGAHSSLKDEQLPLTGPRRFKPARAFFCPTPAVATPRQVARADCCTLFNGQS